MIKYLLALTVLVCTSLSSYATQYSLISSDASFKPLMMAAKVELSENIEKNGFLLSTPFELLGKEVVAVDHLGLNGEVVFSTLSGEKLFISTLNNNKASKNIELGINMNEEMQYAYGYENNQSVLKMEWNWEKFNGTKDMNVRYQLWIYEDGNFEIHFSDNYSNDLLEDHSMMGIGSTEANMKARNYSFGTNPVQNGLNTAEIDMSLGKCFSFNQNDFIEVGTNVNYLMDDEANMDLFVEFDDLSDCKISIDDEQGNVLYTERISKENIVERNIDIEKTISDVYYIHVETDDKIYVKQVALRQQ